MSPPSLVSTMVANLMIVAVAGLKVVSKPVSESVAASAVHSVVEKQASRKALAGLDTESELTVAPTFAALLG